VNRYLLDSMAGVGRGAVASLGLEDSGRDVMNLFFDRISHPALTDVAIDWGNMHVSDVYPAQLPDLFVGRPVVVTGKFLGKPSRPRAAGRAGGRGVEFAIPHDVDAPEPSFLPALWARWRIADLSNQQAWVQDPHRDLARTIKETALAYGLMSDYTAFVAVDATHITEGDHGTTVYQAVPVPEGVKYETSVTP
jgi:Ca-activated chloride channel family protein